MYDLIALLYIFTPSATPEPFSEVYALPMASPDYVRHFPPKKVCLEALLTSLASDQCFVSPDCIIADFQPWDCIAMPYIFKRVTLLRIFKSAILLHIFKRVTLLHISGKPVPMGSQLADYQLRGHGLNEVCA
jgi:hypothetical protein